MLHCRVCSKKMYSGSSFESHLEGKPHKLALEKVDSYYKSQLEKMRNDAVFQEKMDQYTVTHTKRRGIKMTDCHCQVCNVGFKGYMFAHRKCASHKKIKDFIYPKCNWCEKTYQSRLDWERHRHSPEHLRKKFASIQNMAKTGIVYIYCIIIFL